MSFITALGDRRLTSTLILAFCWMLVVRGCFYLQSGVWPDLLPLLASDLAGALILAVLLILARSRLSRTVLILLLGVVLYIAGIHMSAHGTYPRIALVSKSADPVFLASSVFNMHMLLLPLYIGLVWLLVFIHRWLVPIPPRPAVAPLLVGAITIATYIAASQSLTIPTNNVVASLSAQIPLAILAPAGIAIEEQITVAEVEVDDDMEFFHSKAATPAVTDRPNFLIIMVEGLSAAYFPSVAEYHDLRPAITLPDLERKLASAGFRLYRNTLSMERQTDRGSYAILCGQYPDFQRLSTKVEDVAKARANPECMPELLRQRGYYTAYWQAAPLEYMSKDQFMPQIGFAESTGAGVFEAEGTEVEGWGPPDPVYYANVAERLKALAREHQPWMVTLLNVGTHHPFDTGEALTSTKDGEVEVPMAPQGDRRQAMGVMERSLIEFLDQMESAGVLKNTLVVLTSDESGGFVRQGQEFLPLNGNTGVLAIRPPAGDTLDRYADRDRIVVQMDIPVTVLDVMGQGEHVDQMIGRSLLIREDLTQRELLLADTYTGMKFFLRESGLLMSCTESLLRCETWRFEPGRLFGTLTQTDLEPFLTLEQRLELFDQASVITGPHATGNNE